MRGGVLHHGGSCVSLLYGNDDNVTTFLPFGHLARIFGQMILITFETIHTFIPGNIDLAGHTGRHGELLWFEHHLFIVAIN